MLLDLKPVLAMLSDSLQELTVLILAPRTIFDLRISLGLARDLASSLATTLRCRFLDSLTFGFGVPLALLGCSFLFFSL